jgi:hypothetical protein
VRETLGPYRAALVQGRRRSILLLTLIAVGIFGAVAWSSYGRLRTERAFLALLESPQPLNEQSFFKFGVGFGCEFSGPGPGPGENPGRAASGEIPPPGGESPIPVPPKLGGGNPTTCQLISRSGNPIGPRFPVNAGDENGPRMDPAALEAVRPDMIREERINVAKAKVALAPGWIFQSRVRTAGAIHGVIFVVLFGATFFGAEWRWGVWRTLLTHEPRRGRVLAAKLGALWTFVAAGFVLALAVASGVDVVMRLLSDVHTSGGPSIVRLAKESGWSLLSLETYATMAGALALAVRTSLAGFMPLPLTVGEWFLVRKFLFLRPFSPVQQVAYLVPHLPEDKVASGFGWFPALTSKVTCRTLPGQSFAGVCKEIALRPIPHWRATLVLLAWIAAASLLGWMVLRRRDVPQ